MSEPIPEAIPTSADPRSRRPVKRLRGANTATATQANEIENLMWDPDRPVILPQLSSESKPKLAAPPEIVANVQGSSAGAGSGEFHVYKASRRRENERLKVMDEEAQKEEDDAIWEKKLEEQRRKDDEKTKKNREKRNRRKGKKGQKEGTPAGEDADGGEQKNPVTKKPLQILRRDDLNGKDDKHDVGVADESPQNAITIHDDD